MKSIRNIIACAAVGAAMVGCTDFIDPQYNVEKPESIAQYEYLNDYQPLKSYIDRTAHPNFRLGAAIAATDYNKKGAQYSLVNTNFDIVTAGNEMKYASIVDNSGSMNFATVESFVDAAKAADMDIYGHTLVWHSQQNVKYLNSLLADKIDPNYTGSPEDEWHWEYKTENTRCVRVETQDKASDPWDSQFWIVLPGVSFAEGDKFEVTFKCKANYEASGIATQWHAAPGAYLDWRGAGSCNFSAEWETFTANGTIPAEAAGGYSMAFNLNDCATANTYYFKDLSFLLNGEEKVVNGDLGSDDNQSFYAKEYPITDPYPATIVDSFEIPVKVDGPAPQETTEMVNCIEVRAADKKSDPWDTQFWIQFPGKTFAAGDKWEVSMDVRAAKEATSGTQVHAAPSNYLHWSAIGTVNFTTEWANYTFTGSCPSEGDGGWSIAFNLNDFAEANTYWYKNISFKVNGEEWVVNGDCSDPNGTDNFITKEDQGDLVPSRIVDHITIVTTPEGSSGKIPLTPEEKKEIITNALDTWIAGMMEATAGYVTAWDLVNEAVSGGGDDGNGFFALQHAETAGDDAANLFFWQDYLGDDDFVAIASKSARKHFEANGGNAADLKLFVNDYNLEMNWNDGDKANKKCQSLINWVKRWEAAGAKIDGIGTQMHISLYLNPAEHEKRKAAIENMFKLLAESGKLVRVTELDMGLIDEDGNTVNTEDVTLEQAQAMAEHYKWIIQKYLEIIPATQQFGITQWCLTHSPASSGWRPNEPVGLWDLNFARQPQYAGFAEGLQGN